MTDLKDLTFLIALKIDSEDRLNNLDTTINYLQYHFNTNIVICEQDVQPKIKNRYNCEYVFSETKEFFNRQRGVNLAARKAKTPVIVHYDADILLTPNQIKKSVEIISTKQAQIVYPYDGKFYDVPKKYHSQIKQTNSLDDINLAECTLFNPHSVGGAVFFDTNVFWEGGGANEKFIGLGYEDNEIHTRFKTLGYQIARVSKPLFHLTHERKETSFNYNPYLDYNRLEYLKIEKMSKQELINEVSTWNWK